MEIDLPNLIFFLLASVGFTHIVVYSDFILIDWFKKAMRWILPKKLYQVFECSMCLGFWVGMFCGYHLLTQYPIKVFLSGCAASIAAYFTSTFMDYLTANSLVDISND